MRHFRPFVRRRENAVSVHQPSSMGVMLINLILLEVYTWKMRIFGYNLEAHVFVYLDKITVSCSILKNCTNYSQTFIKKIRKNHISFRILCVIRKIQMRIEHDDTAVYRIVSKKKIFLILSTSKVGICLFHVENLLFRPLYGKINHCK